MKFTEVELPSNRKFGFLFAFVFLIISGYFYLNNTTNVAYIFFILAFVFYLVASLKAIILLPLNNLWMRFGLLLSMIVSPIVLGIIFFGLFTPIAFFMRLSGRDELRLKLSKKASHWISRSGPLKSESFKQQF